MSTISDLLTYIFSPVPGRPFNYYYLLVGLIILLQALAIYIYMLVKKAREDKTFKRLFRKYPAKLVTIAVCIGIYLLARYTAVPFLSSRILLYIIVAVLIVFVVQMSNTYLNIYPRDKKKHEELMEKNKYMPKKGSGK